ncbi:glycoside hydrolase family 3 C-terminal domain-containing protein [Spirochaeta isovalerica]|uniref:Beta-glucosidase n=1 Tax=Spirochaeta isovalerica TaxID=150 RepID=A0A841RA14_9SPIO|nr:glycoside hydrolase family 3 C-terminal domain-containing protein [Spirochaeta isovalerica]MBB6479850.1 beta-glucosidase [Spirochaeta isovalerica]
MKFEQIIKEMTLEEKASLMSGKDFWQSRDIPKHGIPSMFLADGPHGLRKQAVAADHLGLNESIPATCFPTAATVANSWNEKLGEEVGKALGEEAAAQKVNVLLGPGINIKRNPLCGRNFEYFSEDPILAGKMAASYIRGIQSKGVSACVKHFCVNNQETNRMAVDAIVDERTLREIYLTAFEIAVKEGNVSTVMSAYNKLNGTYTNENVHILKDILRDEWGFQGCVVTDWGGGNDRVEGLKAGNELEMPTTGGETNREIVEAVKKGQLEESVLDKAVDRLLELAFRTDKYLSQTDQTINWDKHHALARKAAEESIVLLKNEEDILPLKETDTIALIGEFAERARFQGAGSSIVNPKKLDSFLFLCKKSSLSLNGFARGYERFGRRNRKLVREACALAGKSDKILLFLGLDEYTEVEGLDRKDMSIPSNQLNLLEALREVNPNIIVILSSGSVVEMTWVKDAKGVLHGYLSGQAGAGALINILTGEVNPSGKLAETYPLSYKDTPSAPFFPGKEATVEYREGLYVGYRYFSTLNKKVMFPFGFGLSYTDFSYTLLDIDENGVSFTLVNTGKKAGSEVAQLYISRISEEVFRPIIELKGFVKVFLEPGESKQVKIDFDDKSFRYFNEKSNQWEIEGGDYEIIIGASSSDIKLSGHLYLEGSNAETPYEKGSLPAYFSGRVENVEKEEFEMLLGRKVPSPQWDRNRELGYNDTIAQCRYSKGLFARFAFYLIVFAHKFLKGIGKRDTANLIMMSVYYMPFRGMSRMTGGIITMPMLDGILLMANGHFFKGLTKVLSENRKKNRS